MYILHKVYMFYVPLILGDRMAVPMSYRGSFFGRADKCQNCGDTAKRPAAMKRLYIFEAAPDVRKCLCGNCAKWMRIPPSESG